MSRLYSFVAVALLVGLGLGLIYLHCVGRISAITAVATVLGLGTLMILATTLAGAVSQDHATFPRRDARS